MRQADAEQANALMELDPLEAGKNRFPYLLLGIGSTGQAHTAGKGLKITEADFNGNGF